MFRLASLAMLGLGLALVLPAHADFHRGQSNHPVTADGGLGGRWFDLFGQSGGKPRRPRWQPASMGPANYEPGDGPGDAGDSNQGPDGPGLGNQKPSPPLDETDPPNILDQGIETPSYALSGDLEVDLPGQTRPMPVPGAGLLAVVGLAMVSRIYRRS